MSVKFIVTSRTISLNIKGQHHTISREDKRFDQVKNLIQEDRLDELEDLLTSQVKALAEFVEDTGLFVNGGSLQDADGNVLPDVLAHRLKEMKQEGFKVGHMAKFWENLKQNPSMNSREQLYKFLEQNGHPITDDGCFVAYRGIRVDFKDMHTGNFDNTPGQVLEMPRREVDDNPNKTCSRGFHVAAYSYANSFGAVTVEVKVNPRDVVAVPTDYNGQKMRVCRFEVVAVCERPIDTSTYVTPDLAVGYVSLSDEDFDSYEDSEPDVDGEDFEDILELADKYGERYKNRVMLAHRIEEEMFWLSSAEILQVLNENLD